MQRRLPLAVLKRYREVLAIFKEHQVATALTACGIETLLLLRVLVWCRVHVATVLTACGMRRRVPAEERSDDEVRPSLVPDRREKDRVKVLTDYGIETLH